MTLPDASSTRPLSGFASGKPAWSSASRMLASFQMHWGLTGGWWPNEAVSYRSSRSWLPERRIRFDRLVDHLCRVAAPLLPLLTEQIWGDLTGEGSVREPLEGT